MWKLYEKYIIAHLLVAQDLKMFYLGAHILLNKYTLAHLTAKFVTSFAIGKIQFPFQSTKYYTKCLSSHSAALLYGLEFIKLFPSLRRK